MCFLKDKSAMGTNHLAVVVDDDKETTALIMNMLKIINIDSVVAFDNVSAAKAVDSVGHVDLLIVDYMLPDGEGSDTIKYVKENKFKADVPVIMLANDSSNKLPGLLAGANSVLVKPFSEAEFLMVAQNLVSLSDAYNRLADAEQIIHALTNAVEARDAYTRGHSQRVATYSTKIFDILDVNDKLERASVHTGALLHDIGKIGIPDNVLKSEERLNSESLQKIKTHPQVGYEICKKLDRLKPALPVIYQHHERLDGSGYPGGIKKDEIKRAAQIVMIPDMFDAMTTQRSYRDAMPINQALKIMDEDAKNGRINKHLYEIFKYQVIQVQGT